MPLTPINVIWHILNLAPYLRDDPFRQGEVTVVFAQVAEK